METVNRSPCNGIFFVRVSNRGRAICGKGDSLYATGALIVPVDQLDPLSVEVDEAVEGGN